MVSFLYINVPKISLFLVHFSYSLDSSEGIFVVRFGVIDNRYSFTDINIIG